MLPGVGDVRQPRDGATVRRRPCPNRVLLKLKQSQFAAIGRYDLAGAMAEQRLTDNGTDGTATAGHQHGFPLKPRSQALVGGLGTLAHQRRHIHGNRGDPRPCLIRLRRRHREDAKTSGRKGGDIRKVLGQPTEIRTLAHVDFQVRMLAEQRRHVLEAIDIEPLLAPQRWLSLWRQQANDGRCPPVEALRRQRNGGRVLPEHQCGSQIPPPTDH